MTIVNYDWDEIEDNIVEEYEDGGATIAEYTTESSGFGNLISQRRNGQDSVYHYDGQGSTLALTDANGDVTDTYAYSAFGEVTAQTGSTVNPFQYVGQKGYYRDIETGDCEVRRRPLLSQMGRWLSLDQLHMYLQVSLYLYAQNNPLFFLDPSGNAPVFTDPSQCQGTDCDNKAGIKTYENPKAGKDCIDKCKKPIVDEHEGEHRKNMGDCCKRKLKCLEFALEIPEADREKFKLLCETYWMVWKEVNRNSFERRAGVSSCAKAKEIVKKECPADGICKSDCCLLAEKQLYLCKGNDPKAKIECCPFGKEGDFDIGCYKSLEKIYKSIKKP